MVEKERRGSHRQYSRKVERRRLQHNAEAVLMFRQ